MIVIVLPTHGALNVRRKVERAGECIIQLLQRRLTGNSCSHIFKEQGISRWKQGKSSNALQSRGTFCSPDCNLQGLTDEPNVGVALEHTTAPTSTETVLPC
jgi:hypothetical protein